MDNFLNPQSHAKALLLQYRSILDAGAWFASLPEDFKCALMALAQVKQIAANQYVFSRGEAFNGLYCLLNGQVHVNNQNREGKQILLAVLEPTVWFGETAIVDAKPRQCNAIAHTACRVLWIAPNLLQQLLDAEPRHWRHIAALLAERLRWVHHRLEETTLMSSMQRLAMRLLAIAQSEQQRRAVQPLLLHIPQEQLASMLSLSRQTTNQLLKHLQASQILRVDYREIEILNLEALEQLCQHVL